MADMTRQQLEEMQKVYSIRPDFVTGAYVTKLDYEKSILLRLTFIEHNKAVDENAMVSAIIVTLEDFQRMCGLFAEVLRNIAPPTKNVETTT